jgi:peptide/nickel transport system substrate-binding protein
VVFEKNPEFHMKGLPYLDGLTIINTPDVAGQRAAFQVGQNDFFSSQRIAEAQDILKKVPGSQLHAQGGIGGVSVVFRPQLKGPLADVRVRQAMAMTMDHPALWETGIDGFSLFPTLVSRDYFGEEFYMTLDQAGPNYKFDPVKAKQLLTEAGFANGFATSVVSTSSSGVYYDYMLFLQSQWKKHLNIDLKIQSVDFATYNNQFFGGTWEGLIDTGACWIRSCWGTADDAFAQFVIGSPQNLQKVDDATINDLYQKQRGELDSAKRVKLLWEFDQYELTKLYMLRIGVATTFTMMQPWEMNGASHETMWFTAGPNGPTWLAMHDVNKYPGGRR